LSTNARQKQSYFSADVMARYFFHIGGQQPHHDEIGENLADDSPPGEKHCDLREISRRI
jgi:hypothetical protein